jgi:hypothetical protein
MKNTVDNEVLILGAGFSRAINAAMPVTDELGRAAIADAGLDKDPRVPSQAFGPGFPFEAWLSLLAEEEPYLDEASNADNASLFVRLRDALVRVLTASENQAISGAAPDWLYELLSVLHYHRLVVITLNYDTLIETGVRSHQLVTERGGQIGPKDILWDMPPLPPVIQQRNLAAGTGNTFWGATPWEQTQPVGTINPTFRLLKLHGSLDWWAVSNDPSGATLLRDDSGSTFGNMVVLDQQTQEQQFPGRSPLIIPPTATKTGYYRNPMVRQLWQSAFTALVAAGRISLLGYSLTPVDVVVSGMIEAATRSRPVAFDVVNPEPEGPRARLLGLGASEDRINSIGGYDGVERFVGDLCDRASADLVSELVKSDPDACLDIALLVSWGSPLTGGSHIRRVAEIIDPDADGTIELVIDRRQPLVTATEATYDSQGNPVHDPLPSLSDLILAARRAKRIIARSEDGRRFVIVGSWYRYEETGASSKWLALAPAGRQSLQQTA